MGKINDSKKSPKVILESVMKECCDNDITTEIRIPGELERTANVRSCDISTTTLFYNFDSGKSVCIECVDNKENVIDGLEGDYPTKNNNRVRLSTERASELFKVLSASEDDMVLDLVREMLKFEEEIEKAPDESAKKLVDFLSTRDCSTSLQLLRLEPNKVYRLSLKTSNVADASSVEITYGVNEDGGLDNDLYMNCIIIKKLPFGSFRLTAAFRADKMYPNRDFAKFTKGKFVYSLQENSPCEELWSLNTNKTARILI